MSSSSTSASRSLFAPCRNLSQVDKGLADARNRVVAMAQAGSAQVPDVVHFDPNGDVRLLVTDRYLVKKTFVVSSKAMALACDAWGRMFNGYFKEAQPADVREVPLPDDDAAGLSILLNIVHLRFKHVPLNLSFSTLVAVTVLTDKYGATSLIRPWYQSWIDFLHRQLLDPMFEDWLWISWELGLRDSFERLATHLVKTVQVDNTGRCTTDQGRVLNPPDSFLHLPPDIIESIIATRQKAMSDLLQAYHKLVDEYTVAFRSGKTVCQRSDSSSQCDAMAFGSLTLPLRSTGLSLENAKAADLSWSLNELAGKFQGVRVLCCHNSIYASCSNNPLATKVQQSVNQVLLSLPSPLLRSHHRHLNRQWQILNEL